MSEGSVGGALRDATERLRPASQTPRLDAELLLGEALGVGRSRLVIERDRVLSAVVAERFEALVDRRAAHEPVAYLLGRQGFRWLTLAVDRRVLIPRPETELLVEAALGLPVGARVVDVGTGSGAIALAVKHERPDLAVTGVDVSADALAVARGNAARLGLDVSFVAGDLLEGLGSDRFDAVLANLPYVADDEPLTEDVARFEPAGALRAGPDGLRLIRRLLEQIAALAPEPGRSRARRRRRPSLVALEIGCTQGAAVAELVALAGYERVDVRRDLAGLDRVVVGSDLGDGLHGAEAISQMGCGR